MSSTDSIMLASVSAWPGRSGANVMPQLPMTTDVTPCQHDELMSGSQPIWASRWEWRSTNPGVTSLPSASMTSAAPDASTSPTATMRSPSIATSARTAGPPVPSTTVPPLITRSCPIGPPYARGGSIARGENGPNDPVRIVTEFVSMDRSIEEWGIHGRCNAELGTRVSSLLGAVCWAGGEVPLLQALATSRGR